MTKRALAILVFLSLLWMPRVVQARRAGYLQVTSVPSGADVYLVRQSGKRYFVGTTPTRRRRVNVGSYLLTVEKVGYQTSTRSLNIRARRTTRENFRLTEQPLGEGRPPTREKGSTDGALLRSATHPAWACLFFGPAISLDDTPTTPTQFKLGQGFGYHFSGTFSGPAIAFEVQESFGDEFTLLEMGFKFLWDIQVLKGIAFYLSPSITLGIIHMSDEKCISIHDKEICVDISMDGWTLQFGFAGKLILANRALLFFRLVTIDVMRGTVVFPIPTGTSSSSSSSAWKTGARYDLLFGGGIIF